VSNLRRPLLIGASAWPLLYWSLFLFILLPWWDGLDTSKQFPNTGQLIAVGVLHLLTMLLLLGLSIYGWVAISRSAMDRHQKILWALLILFASPITLPLFFSVGPHVARGAAHTA
jgi:hypothetical protein